MLLYEAGNVIRTRARKFNGVVPGELYLVLFGFGQLLVKEVDVIDIAVHGPRSSGAPIPPA